ncbi:hypothetical protein VK792_19455 [Mesobacterium sp. TK19101]|uniref:Uncharacterized protein n=1 Tax=Mesobacterium hydrothermale TaxID=3111907 RepID=A0ABU6HMB6_9RHOB|nr:hypothetical protein [Mesobacterium sp. TK19101]MEC3863461.1 hypothetical protein [Mesobacterium sp. TK19101]
MRKVLSFKEFRSVVSPHVSFEGQKNAAKEAVGSISRKLTNSDVEHTLLLQDAAVFSGEYETEDKAKASVNEYHAKSLRQGTGHRKFAWQVYYYLHRQYPNSESLGQFDRTLFEGMTFSEYFGYSVNDRPEDYEVLPRGPSTPDQHKQLGRTRRSRELVLSLDVVEGSSHYTKQLTAFLGRESEMEELQIFRDSKGAAFLWIQLAGEAGQGKSRLAFEFSTISQADGWHSGFLQTDELSRFADYCEDWLPEAPTLIFVDYVLGKEGHIQKLVRSFERSSQNFSNPVRLVLIERQRWDRGNLAMIALSDDGTNDSSARTSSTGLASLACPHRVVRLKC